VGSTGLQLATCLEYLPWELKVGQKSWPKEEESSAIRVVELVVSLAIKLVLYKEETLLQELKKLWEYDEIDFPEVGDFLVKKHLIMGYLRSSNTSDKRLIELLSIPKTNSFFRLLHFFLNEPLFIN
jgi:hypothetical protein